MSNLLIMYAGRLYGIWESGPCPFPRMIVKRASHVEPANFWGRWAFRLFRRLFGDKGRVATWTRTWDVQWEVDLSPIGGPRIGPFYPRSKAIAEERLSVVEYLKERARIEGRRCFLPVS